MKNIILQPNEIEEIRKFAIQIADSPYLVDLIASLLYDIVKKGKNDITDSCISSIEGIDLKDEDEIPIPVVVFLKDNVVKRGRGSTKKVRLARINLFIEMIRKNVLQKIKSETKISCKEMAMYSEIFNMNYIKAHFSHVDDYNETRFVIAVGLGEEDYYGILEGSPEYIDKFYEFFESSYTHQVKHLIEAYNFIYL